jgi:hypothetical protein
MIKYGNMDIGSKVALSAAIGGTAQAVFILAACACVF